MSAPVLQYSLEQIAAIDAIHDWLHDPDRQTLSLGGYAGTGKTTVIKEVVRIARRSIRGNVGVCAPTGKAAHVLRSKGVDFAATVHSTIYSVRDVCRDCGQMACSPESPTSIPAGVEGKPAKPCKSRGRRAAFSRVDEIPFSLLVVDEASMLSRRLVEDLQSFDCKILYVGDHGQLEPIGGDAGVMQDPDLRLEQIHRQAAGNPIIQFAHAVRQGASPADVEVLPAGADRLRIRRGLPEHRELADFEIILCGFNETRVAVNRRVRTLRGHVRRGPLHDEPVICLRNNGDLGLFNGMLARVEEVDHSTSRISITTETGRDLARLPFEPEQFGAQQTLGEADRDLALFDYGYCITVHKSQGSEWRDVCVLEQLSPSWAAARWRYTAATRAAGRLTWCTSEGRRR